MNALIDTCVVLDALMLRDGFGDSAKEIFKLATKKVFNGFLSPKTVLDTYYYLHKFLHDDKATRENIRGLRRAFALLDVLGGDCDNAIDSPLTDYEDAVIEEVALRSDIQYIVTRNIKDYKDSRVDVIEPDDFLALLR